jgi:hypothetical protein
MILSLPITTLTEELEALQLAVNNAAEALNARGDLLENRLRDVPIHAGEIALNSIRQELPLP